MINVGDILKEEEIMIVHHKEGLVIDMMDHIDVYAEAHLEHAQGHVLGQDQEKNMLLEYDLEQGPGLGLDLQGQEQDHVRDRFLGHVHAPSHLEVSGSMLRDYVVDYCLRKDRNLTEMFN